MKPLKPITPPPPGTKKADEQRLAEADLLDAFLCIQEVCQLGLARCVTLAGVGIVNIVTSLDHPAEPVAEVPEDAEQLERVAEAIHRNETNGNASPWAEVEEFSRVRYLSTARAAIAAAAKPAPAGPPKPVIRRYAAINHYEGFLAAGAASYNQIVHLAQDSTDEKLKGLALKFIDHLKEIRERRTKRIITQGLTA